MKPPLTILPLLLLLPHYSLSQNCPFSTGNLRIDVTGRDVDETAIWSEPLTLEPGVHVTSVSIGDAKVAGLLNPEFTETSDTTWQVTLTPIQPNFRDVVDYEWFTESVSDNPSEGLIIQLDNGPELRCVINLRIFDTNNRAPVINDTSRDLNFPIRTSWDTNLPLNWDVNIKITDWDYTPSITSIDVSPDDGVLEFRVTRTRDDEPGIEYEVLVFLKDTPPVGHHEYTLTANDGVPHDDAIPVQLVLDVEEIKDHEPRFATDPYVVVLDSMPEAEHELEIELQAIDPDDKFNGRESNFVFSVDPGSDFVTVPPNSNKIVFTTSVPELAGTIVEVGLTATQDNNENDKATSLLKIHFPPRSPPKFNTYYVIDFEWPEDDSSRRKPLPPPEDGSSVIYELGKTSAPGAVTITDLEIVLADNFDPENLGELGDNKVVILEVKAYHADVRDVEVVSLFTVVLSFPVDPVTEPTTTEGTTEGTTECPVCPTDPTEPTTSGATECPEPPPCPTEPTTTGSESTDCPVCPTDPTDPTTTSGTTDCPECPTCPTGPTEPTTTGTSDCPEPPSCPTEPTTSTECPICPTTGPTDPTTSGTTDYTGSTVCPEPPPCPTDPTTTGPTECPPTSCPTDPTETTTSGSTGSTGSTVCPEPPPCPTDPTGPTDSTTLGSTCPECPDCPTTSTSSQSTDPTQTDFTCSPCPSPPECGTGSTEFTVTSTDTTCDCGITSSDGCPVVTCPTQPSTTRRSDDCDCDDDEDDDCSTTGLVAGIITTSILAVTGICAAGYMFYLLRRSTPTLSTESLIDSKPHMEVESPPTPPVQNRFTPQDSGYSNTSLIYDEPVITPEPIVTQAEPPVTPVVTDSVPLTSQSDPQPKKSNMKPPKEIEPDYEEVQPTSTSETPKTGETPQRKHSTSRVLFAQDDDVRVINEPEPTNEVVSDFEEASDVENERL